MQVGGFSFEETNKVILYIILYVFLLLFRIDWYYISQIKSISTLDTFVAVDAPGARDAALGFFV